MLIVIISIPLSILTALIALKLSNQTINTMTLGGLSLAVGMLVDVPRSRCENIHRNHACTSPTGLRFSTGRRRSPCRRSSARLAICIVFFRSCCSPASAKFLFSYHSRGRRVRDAHVLPLVAHLGADDGPLLLPATHQEPAATVCGALHPLVQPPFGVLPRRLRAAWVRSLPAAPLPHLHGSLVAPSSLLLLVVGQDFFPVVDAA